MRITMFARGLEGLKAKVRARSRRQEAAALAFSQQDALETFNLAAALANFDTGYMLGHMVLEFTRGGFNWRIGFRAEDFIGQTNTLASPPRLIIAFYPVFVIKGTRKMAGNNFLLEAQRLRAAARRAGYLAALRA